MNAREKDALIGRMLEQDRKPIALVSPPAGSTAKQTPEPALQVQPSPQPPHRKPMPEVGPASGNFDEM